MATGMVDGVEWRRFRRSLREPQQWLTIVNSVQVSTLSLCTYVPLVRPVRVFRYPATRATPDQHHYTYQTMYTTNYWEHRTYPDVTISLLLQGTELRPRAIHYDTVLLFPQLHFLFCLLFFDALFHHVYVFLFLFVSVDFEVEMESHDETVAPDQPVG